MSQRQMYSAIFACIFLGSAYGFWQQAALLYETPFFWANFSYDWLFDIIPLSIVITFAVISSSLLTILKPSRVISTLVYAMGGAFSAIHLQTDIYTFISALIFVTGFLIYEQANTTIFHSYITLNFWQTYSKTVPTVISMMVLAIAVSIINPTQANLGTFKLTIPDAMLDQVVDLALSGTASSTSPATQTTTTQSAPQAAPFISDELLNSMLEPQFKENNITDPAQQEALRQEVRKQVEQQLQSNAQPQTTTTATSTTPQNLVKEQVRALARSEFDRQSKILVTQYAPYIPFVSAVATFFLLNILNLPIMLLSIALVVGIMTLFRKLGIISVVKVKMEVERLAM